MEVTKDVREKIINEINSWDLIGYTNASHDEVIEYAITLCHNDEYTLEDIFDITEDSFDDGSLDEYLMEKSRG